MRVLLVYAAPPPTAWPRGRFHSHWIPSGVGQIAAQLRSAGHDVRVVVREEELMKLSFDWPAADRRLASVLTELKPEIVGISTVTPAMIECEMISRLAKQLVGPHVLVIAGGHHATALPETTLDECPAVDAIVVGEGEATMVDLASRGLAPDVAGLVYRRDGRYIRTPPRPPWSDLDALEPIPYDLFDMDYYTRRNRWMIRWLPLSATNLRTSRGCPARCRFCAGYLTAGVGVRFHSLDYITDRLACAVETLGVEAILFEDETLGADPDRLRALCERIRRRGWSRKIRWSGCLRVDQVTSELLADMKSAGCLQIEYGFETGSDAMLKRLAKNTSIEQNRRAVRLTREAGIRIFADIMVGLPDETERDLAATVAFLRWAKPDVISATQLNPLPGTPIYNALTDAQRAAVHWSGYTYADKPGFRVNLTAMSDERFFALYHRFRKHFLKPALYKQLYRDAAPGDRRRDQWRRKILSFALRHPIANARLPV